ncbi:hypothetical protein D3C78_1787480 [compost metagenome]
MAAGHEAGQRVEEGVQAQQHGDAAGQRQDQRLDMPVAELETPAALRLQQAHDEQGKQGCAGVDRAEEAIEDDRDGA